MNTAIEIPKKNGLANFIETRVSILLKHDWADEKLSGETRNRLKLTEKREEDKNAL